MSKKTLRIILLPVIILAATSAAINIRPPARSMPAPVTQSETAQTEATPQPAVSGYRVMLSDGVICLYTLDASGAELDRKIIDYIDVYSLYPSQINTLLAGASFDSREAAAEFIQDLGS